MVAAAVRLGREHANAVAAPAVGGSFWSARNAAGQPLRNRPLEDGLWLAPGDGIEFEEREAEDRRLRRLDLRLELAGRQSSAVHVDFRRQGAARARLTVVPRRDVSLQLVTRNAAGEERVVASAEIAGARERPRDPYRLSLRAEGDRVEVWIDEAKLLEGTLDLPTRGALAFASDGARLRGIELEFEHDGEAGVERLVHADDLTRRTGSGTRAWLSRTLLVLLLAAAAGPWLRALCLGRPTLRRVGAATLVLVAPAAAAVAFSPWSAPLPALLGPLAGALTLFAAPVALFVLRRDLVAPAAGGSRTPRATVAVRTALALALVAGTGALAWDARADRVEAAARQARIDAPDLSSVAVSRPELRRLDAGSSIVLAGPYGGFVLEADVRLSEGAIVEVRQGRPDAAVGTALVLSADARWPSGLRHLGPRRIDRLGGDGPVLEPERVERLRFEGRGTAFAARWGEAVIAEAEDLDAEAGPVTLVAVRGEADVSLLTLSPIEPGEVRARPPGANETRPFLLGLALLLAASCGVSWLSRRPLLPTLEVAAFALLPAALALRAVDDGFVPVSLTFAAAVGAGGMLLLVPLAHGRMLRGLRVAAASLVAVAGGAASTVLILPGAGDGSGDSATRALDFATFEGPRLLEGLTHYQHPRSRALNGYLAGHFFRGRRFAAGRRPEGARVVCVGSSSTWGAGTAENSGLDWPTVLESMLPPGTEVINAGIRGSNATLLSVFHEEVLARFDPDVVVVCLFHNDAVSLPQFDAPALLARLRDRASSVGALERFLVRREIAAGVAANARFLSRITAGVDPVAAWRAEAGGPPTRSPPERFAAALGRLLERTTAAGARLVLVKEPVFPDPASRGDPQDGGGAAEARDVTIWRESFDAVLERAGATYDAPVVDPSPRLEREGGRALFMDHVHLQPAGHRVMADVLRPYVEAELDRGRRSP